MQASERGHRHSRHPRHTHTHTHPQHTQSTVSNWAIRVKLRTKRRRDLAVVAHEYTWNACVAHHAPVPSSRTTPWCADARDLGSAGIWWTDRQVPRAMRSLCAHAINWPKAPARLLLVARGWPPKSPFRATQSLMQAMRPAWNERPQAMPALSCSLRSGSSRRW